jgi:hypothetical protein
MSTETIRVRFAPPSAAGPLKVDNARRSRGSAMGFPSVRQRAERLMGAWGR